MKKYLSKQLMMLAILLLSGIGGAFAQDETFSITATWNYADKANLNVHFSSEDEYVVVESGVACNLSKSNSYRLGIDNPNPDVYSISSIVIDNGEDVKDLLYTEKGITFEDGADHSVVITFAKAASKTITVNWASDNNYGSVRFENEDYHSIYVYKPYEATPTTVELVEGKEYKMYIRPDNPLVNGITAKVGETDITDSYNNKGFYPILLNNDTSVTVNFVRKSEDIKHITVKWNTELCGADVTIAELQGEEPTNNAIYTSESGCSWEVAAGTNYDYRVQIRPNNPLINYVSGIQIGNTSHGFNTSPDGSSYFNIKGLTKDTTVIVTLAARETNTVTVTWGEGCDGVGVMDLNYNYLEHQSYSEEGKNGIWALPNGSYRLAISLPKPWDYFATVKIGDGEPVNAKYNEYEYRYEFDIENLSSDTIIAVSAVAIPTHEIAVSCTYLDALDVQFFDQNNGNWFGLNEDGKANLRSDKTYRMYISNRVPDVYSFTSIMLDETDYTEYFTDEDGNNNFIEFDKVAADHTVAITLDKEPSNTITINRNGEFVWANLEKVVDNWNRYGIGSKSETESIVEWEVLSNQTYRVSIGVHNPLIYEITSVIIDKDTDGEADITEIFTDNNNDNNYIEFADISANHTVDVVAAKQGETKQFTLKAFIDKGNGEERIWYGEYSDIELYDQAKEKMIGAGESFELLTGSTTQLMITPHTGYKVKTIIVDKDNVTESFNTNNGYYEFANIDAGHSIKVVFEVATTHYVKVTSNIEAGQFIVEAKGAYYDNRFNTELNFNEGTNVIMRVDSLFSKWDEENNCWVMYKLTKIMDGETDITPSTTNENNRYEVSFNNLSANHNVSLTYEPIPYYNVTVTFDGIEARLEPVKSEYWISSGKPYKYEEGESVKLILNIETGHKLTSVTVDGTPVDYTAGGIILTENISGDIVVNVTTEEVQAYYVSAGFTQYSQGTVYMESDLYGKRETNWDEFNAGSNVTVTIVPSIGYEVSKLVLAKNIDNEPRVETTVDAVYNEVNKEYTYVIENLDAYYELSITNAKKSMAGIEPQPYTLGENGMGTYCSEYDLDFSNIEGITAYIASGFDPVEGYVVLTKVFKVPAGTGIIIKGTPGNYEIPVVATNFYYRNMLVGVVKATPVPQTDRKDVEYANYILLKKDSDTEPTFYRSDGSGDIPANRAYLQIPLNLVPSANNARITTVFEDEVTPVEDILTTSDNSKDDYYNLNGQKVQTVKKGIYIKNGKKVIIR